MWNLSVFLSLVWALTLLYGEMFSFWMPSFSSCSWPHLSKMDRAVTGYPGDYVKVAIVADPQLMDKTSIGLAPKSLALEIVQFYTDLFMRRAFLASILPFKPDVILFLGDYFDGGPFLSDEEWQESLSRFKHIFDLNRQRRMTNIPKYFIAGNHDIGYAYISNYSPEVIRRYEKEFRTSNYRFTIGKVDFISIDAQTIDGNSKGSMSSATWAFVKNVSADIGLNPRVLLTHIPLYRSDSNPCGPYRTSPVINQRVSRGGQHKEIVYQNYVTEETSNKLLDLIKPVLVLSGHDHDQCTVTHMPKYGPVKEHTVGTISWQQGNLYPSFMLLSASNHKFLNASSSEEAVSTQLCFLPIQLYIYLWYISLFVLTLLLLLLWPTKGMNVWGHFSDLMEYTGRLINSCSVGTKEKNEDENCEYEMVWDAEGSMHLVKKTSNAPLPRSSEGGLTDSMRGNVVLRATAKKPTSHDTEASASLTVDMDSESMVKLPIRPVKSKTRTVIRRLFRAFRMLTVIAAVNVPLYMMLLFKDWVQN